MAMSSTTEILADKSDAAEMTEAQMLKRKPSGKKVYKPHISTKIKWALEDAMLGTQEAQQYMLEILALMDEARQMKDDDTAWLVHLGKIDHQIAYLALVVAGLERTITRAVAESKPESKCK
jgi:hypothetical protein